VITLNAETSLLKMGKLAAQQASSSGHLTVSLLKMHYFCYKQRKKKKAQKNGNNNF